VNVETLLRLLTGRHPPETARSKRLLTDDRSNILIYLTGHGGDEFLKFQDVEEISSHDIADAFKQMHEKRRYNEILFIVDTCQANTLYKRFYSPNILAIGSSKYAENSYSHHSDSKLGLAVIDRFTYYTLEFFEQVTPDSNSTIKDLFFSYDPAKVGSHPEWREDLYTRQLDSVLLTEFFGSVIHVELTKFAYPVTGRSENNKPRSGVTTNDIVQKQRMEEPNGEQSKRADLIQKKKKQLFNPQFMSAAALFVVIVAACSHFAK